MAQNSDNALAIDHYATGSWVEKLRITSGGDVGVGNDSPNCRLAVKDVAEHTAYASVTPSVGDCMVQLYNNPPNETANDHATIQFGVNGGSHNRVNTISAVAESAGNRKMAFTFCTDEAGSRSEKMRITGDGKVGIRFKHNYTMNSQSTDLVIGDGGGGRGITLWTAAAADNQTISFQTNETLSRAEGEISYGPTNTSTAADRNAMMFRTNSAERLRITSSGRFGFNRSAPHYAMHLSPADSETRIDLHMTNDTTGHNSNDGVQFGYQNSAGAYIWNFENNPIYMATNNVKKFEIHATGSTQIYKGDLLLGPDNVSQMEATIRAWGCSLWYTTIDTDYYHCLLYTSDAADE